MISLSSIPRIAMLRGIEDNEIIAGSYADKRIGGICPMLAAHRNGGRTRLSSFECAWDRFTDASGPRLATPREVRALRSNIELSLLREDQDEQSLAALAHGIRSERARASWPPAATGERHRARELRRKRLWAWLIPTRRYLSLIHISEPTRLRRISYAVFCLKKKKHNSPRPTSPPGNVQTHGTARAPQTPQ